MNLVAPMDVTYGQVAGKEGKKVQSQPGAEEPPPVQPEPESPLAIISTLNSAEIRTIFGRDSKNRIFIDRDGILFRYILDYL